MLIPSTVNLKLPNLIFQVSRALYITVFVQRNIENRDLVFNKLSTATPLDIIFFYCNLLE